MKYIKLHTIFNTLEIIYRFINSSSTSSSNFYAGKPNSS